MDTETQEVYSSNGDVSIVHTDESVPPIRIRRIVAETAVDEDLDVSIVHGDATVEFLPGRSNYKYSRLLILFGLATPPQPRQKRKRQVHHEAEGRRTRSRLSSPERRAGTSSTPTTAERSIVEQYAGLGISGERKIPVSQAVSQEYRLPEEIRALGHMVIRLYVDERIKKIEEHNKKVLDQVREDTLLLREATRGQGVVICPECMEDVAWGHIMGHRTRTCPNSRV